MAQQTIVIEVPGTPISELEPTSSVSPNDVLPIVQGEETKKAPLEQVADMVKAGLGSAALKNEADFATPAALNSVAQASQIRDDAQNERIDFVEFGVATFQGGYFKSYVTLEAANADISNIPLNVSVKVLSAEDGGDYYKESVDASQLKKSPFDPNFQLKKSVDELKQNVAAISSETVHQEGTFFYDAGSGKISKETNPILFAVVINVKAGQYLVINAKGFGVVGVFYITDVEGNIIEKMEAIEATDNSYFVKIPDFADKLYVNCVNDYANDFSVSKIPSGVAKLMHGFDRQQFTYYTQSGSKVVKANNHGLFAKEFEVQANEFFLINTQSFGVAKECYVTDSDNNILEMLSVDAGNNKPYLLKTPASASKLYINCAYSFADKFKVEKLPNRFLSLLSLGCKRQDFTFHHSEDDIHIKKDQNTELFTVEIDVIENQYYAISTQSFSVAGKCYVVDESGVILLSKTADNATTDFLIKMPALASKLYINCTYNFEDKFNVTRVPNSVIDIIPVPIESVRDLFPKPNYFNILNEKCPQFYRKYKNKNEDVCIVLTGTSLTQGNLYASTRSDATTRPPALHTNDFASAIFDTLIKGWDGQQYRRFDHPDLSYSASSWLVLNQLDNYVWDDYAHIKNGLTKTTTDANASVSKIIPSDAWQFNFIYRTDSQGGNCSVSITEGNNKVEVWNGAAWVEANGFAFSMYESPATETKGNTQYQKRLKMRCKNRAVGGINSLGMTKTITVSKGNNSDRFNVVGFEWSHREFMFTLINSARGGHEWGDPTGNRLDQYQDNDIWSFNPDLLLAEITVNNWGASEPSALTKDPLHYVNIAKRAYFNEFNDMSTSLHAKSEAYTKCDVVFYGDILSAHVSLADAWDPATYQPKFGIVSEAAQNGAVIDNVNVGRAKTNFENYEAIDAYMKSKTDFIYISATSTFRSIAEKFYGTYWAGMQASGTSGKTLSFDGTHLNDNGAALWASLICPLFENL